MVDCVMMAFDLAEKYRTVTMVIADGMIGQMMEPVELPPMRELERKDWDFALRGCQGREKRIITSLYLGAENLERVNDRLQARLKEIVAHEQRWETTAGDDAEVLVVAFGTAARIAKTAIRQAREQGIKAGLFRPITVFPYPYDALAEAAGVQQQTLRVSRRTVGSHTLRVSVRDGGKRRSRAGKKLLVFELNAGQMLEDVRLATRDSVPIAFYGRTGGVVPLPEDVLAEIIKLSG
jgi:2-oxoglutarate ferredoxin oxidoreductase subunit alpha